jgi:hypothetical protein
MMANFYNEEHKGITKATKRNKPGLVRFVFSLRGLCGKYAANHLKLIIKTASLIM